jgi:tellurite resistance protein TehA-like permease
MSTGVVSILLHQLPYNGHWLQIISVIFFIFNICIFVLFSIISCLRYSFYPKIFLVVLRHPHQSLFLATFPIGLATIINMIVLVCVPVWGHGMATLAWVLWWIVSVLALTSCFHLTYVMSVFPISHLYQGRLSFLLRTPMHLRR